MRRAAIVLFAAIPLLAIDWPMIADLAARRDELRTARARNADRAPGLAGFLTEVRARTQKGDSVALVLSAPDAATYGYGYIRATYALAGRRVIPMMSEAGQYRDAEINQARYLALFRMRYLGPGQVIWRNAYGMLVKQR